MTQLTDLVFIDSSGYHYADFPTFLEYVKSSYREIYGADVYLEPDSQDGQLIANQAKQMYDSAALGAAIYNSFSPSTAIGVALSSNVKINGIKRSIPTKSSVDLTIIGVAGTLIQNGVAEDTLNQKWILPASVLIPLTGTITVTALAEIEGAVSALPNTINKIYTPTRGWQSVDNEFSAVEGEPVESDAELRQRQTSSVALPSLTVFEGAKGAIANIPGVSRSEGYENDTGVTDANGLPPHSVSFVVDGGDALEIATVIANKKTPGTETYGDESQVVFDRYGMPNTINFYRPTQVDIEVEVELTALQGYTVGYDTLIKQAIADLINNLKIGQSVLITKLYVPANLPGTTPGTTFDIISIKIAKVGDALGVINVPILFNEVAQCDVNDINVVVIP